MSYSRDTDRLESRRAGLFAAFVLLISAPLFYVYLIFPREKDFLFFIPGYSINVNFFVSIQLFVYYFFRKLISLAIFSLWFIHCRRGWWRFLALPLLMYGVEFFYIIGLGLGLVGEDQHIYFLPLALFGMYFLYRARKRWHTERVCIQKARWGALDYFVLFALLVYVPCSYAYRLFPKENISYFFSEYFKNVQVSVYFLSSVLVPLILLFIWFLTCKTWWSYFIAVPLLAYWFQLVDIIVIDANVIDYDLKIYLFPVALFMAYILSRIWKKCRAFGEKESEEHQRIREFRKYIRERLDLDNN